MTDSFSHVASHSEWLLYGTLQKRVVVFLVDFSAQYRILTGYSKYSRVSCTSSA
jgi:Zn-dependent membrane protease YugP